MDTLTAAAAIGKSPVLIPSLLVAVCTIGYFCAYWQIAGSWRLKARVVGAAFVGFAVTEGLGGARGGNLNNILFLFSDLMLFFAIYGFSEVYARHKRRNSGMNARDLDAWRETFRRRRLAGALVVSCLLFAAGYLPIW
jgi:hypothetical protein